MSCPSDHKPAMACRIVIKNVGLMPIMTCPTCNRWTLRLSIKDRLAGRRSEYVRITEEHNREVAARAAR